MLHHQWHQHPRVPVRYALWGPFVLLFALPATLSAPGCTASFDTVDSGLSPDGSVSYVSVDPTLTWPRSSVVSCTPGRLYGIGCNAGCSVGSCSGDPVMRFCDGQATAAACGTGAMALRSDVDDPPSRTCTTGTDRCPYSDIVCPPSGSVRVLVRPLGDGATYTCNVAWRAQ